MNALHSKIMRGVVSTATSPIQRRSRFLVAHGQNVTLIARTNFFIEIEQPMSGDNLTSFFDALAVHWDAAQPADRDAHLTRLLAPHAAVLASARRVLDVGTGTGAFLPHLYRLAPEAAVIGIDLSYVMLAQARSSGRARQVCAWLRADAHQIPLAGEQIDLITCHDSFAHLEDRLKALREFKRVLVPGGHLLVVHDISRVRVNAVHGRADHPRIWLHTLPPVDDLVGDVQSAGFTVLAADDAPDHYLLTAHRA
jgi:ubiquinone/menaquinone biosynthesis C-methylase UbiE